MHIKRSHAVLLEVPTSGLPRTWRATVAEVVRQVGQAFTLYITDVAVGESARPEGVLISIKRQGAEEAWNTRVEDAMRRRLMDELESLREAEIAHQVEALGIAVPTPAGPRRIRAVEPPHPAGVGAARVRAIERRRVLDGIANALGAAVLPDAVRQLADLAIWQMRDPTRWALWAQILLAVVEVEEVLPPALLAETRALVGE